MAVMLWWWSIYVGCCAEPQICRCIKNGCEAFVLDGCPGPGDAKESMLPWEDDAKRILL